MQPAEVREVEDERQRDPVGGAELPFHSMRAPGELVGVGGGSGKGKLLLPSRRTVGSHLYRGSPALGLTARSRLRDLIERAPAR